MNLALQKLLSRLAELKKTPVPSRHDVSTGSGLALPIVTRIFSLPQTKLAQSDFDKLLNYLFSEFRPHTAPEVSDEQLLNQLRFDLVDFASGPRLTKD